MKAPLRTREDQTTSSHDCIERRAAPLPLRARRPMEQNQRIGRMLPPSVPGFLIKSSFLRPDGKGSNVSGLKTDKA
jgi:hypothetical protein